MKGISKTPETEGHTCNLMNRVTIETVVSHIPAAMQRPFAGIPLAELCTEDP